MSLFLDIGLDFDGTDWSFLESPAFLLAVLALAVLLYVAERSGVNKRVVSAGAAAVAAILGALLFAGSLAEGGNSGIPGLVAGVACALLAYFAIGGLLERVAKRLDAAAAKLLSLYADVTALLLAAIAIFLPPVAFLALVAFVLLLVKGRRDQGRKYAGLRILR